MKTSDHPAAKPRPYRAPEPRDTFDALRAEEAAPVFRAAVSDERLAEIAAIRDEDIDTSDIPELPPQPTREPIHSAPQDGSYLRAFWGSDDDTGRLVRWREGRHFNNRRWVTGGTWAPADGMVPLPAEAPTEWLKPAEEPEPDEGEPAEAEEAA
jgi:hypothetical protein